jgi:hypothetical protein
MVQRASQPDPDMDRRAHIVALFSVLIDARHKSQFSQAADAQTELERSGVIVTFQRPESHQGVPRAK